jgi:hypothetical protein
MTEVVPVERHHLLEVGAFLHRTLNQRIAPNAWVASLTHGWAAEPPNFGWQLREADQLVGVFCAIYSDQWIDGRLEKFCNLHSWCVLPEHRNSSPRLVLPLLRQAGYNFTIYTPNGAVAALFLGLRFRRLEDCLLYTFNLPVARPLRGGRFLESDPERIAPRLQGSVLQDFNAHRGIPWLHFVAFGKEDDVCLTVYKRHRWRRMPCAHILHLSNGGAMRRHGQLLAHHLLVQRGLPVSRVEGRFLEVMPYLSISVPRTSAKLVRSDSLAHSRMRNLYTELVALDL